MNPATIVAIGFAEGGLEPLKIFFDNTPLDNTAYIVLADLQPSFRAELQGILDRHSPLKVVEAVTDTVIQSNIVYVASGGTRLSIVKNKLLLSTSKYSGAGDSINFFFISLSKNKQAKFAAIIFSGNAIDVRSGMQALKLAKGLVVAQSPSTAANPFMPQTAIQSGFVDYVMEAASMPDLLIKWTENKQLPMPFKSSIATIDKVHEQQILLQLGQSIKQQRLSKKISQSLFALQLGIQKASLSRIESGQTNTTVLSLLKMAKQLNIGISDFF